MDRMSGYSGQNGGSNHNFPLNANINPINPCQQRQFQMAAQYPTTPLGQNLHDYNALINGHPLNVPSPFQTRPSSTSAPPSDNMMSKVNDHLAALVSLWHTNVRHMESLVNGMEARMDANFIDVKTRLSKLEGMLSHGYMSTFCANSGQFNIPESAMGMAAQPIFVATGFNVRTEEAMLPSASTSSDGSSGTGDGTVTPSHSPREYNEEEGHETRTNASNSSSDDGTCGDEFQIVYESESIGNNQGTCKAEPVERDDSCLTIATLIDVEEINSSAGGEEETPSSRDPERVTSEVVPQFKVENNADENISDKESSMSSMDQQASDGNGAVQDSGSETAKESQNGSSTNSVEQCTTGTINSQEVTHLSTDRPTESDTANEVPNNVRPTVTTADTENCSDNNGSGGNYDCQEPPKSSIAQEKSIGTGHPEDSQVTSYPKGSTTKSRKRSASSVNRPQKQKSVRWISDVTAELECGPSSSSSSVLSPPPPPPTIPRAVPVDIAAAIKKERVAHAVEDENATTRPKCICGYRALTMSSLRKHVKREGAVEPRFMCSQPGCTKRFVYPSDVKYHLEKEHNVRKESVLGCRKCYQLFSKRKDLNHHKNERNEICKESLGRRSARPSIVVDDIAAAVAAVAASVIKKPSIAVTL